MSSYVNNSVYVAAIKTNKHLNMCSGIFAAILKASLWVRGKVFAAILTNKGLENKQQINKMQQDGAQLARQNQGAAIWLTYLLLLLVPLVLYTFRFLDDNRLVSWYWSLSLDQLLVMFSVLSIILIVLALIAKSEILGCQNIAILTLLSFVVLIPFWGLPESIIDNARYFAQAKYVSLYGVSYYLVHWGESIFAWTDLPLIPLLYGVAFNLFGESRVVIQIITSLFFSGTVLLTYLIGKRLWSETHGFLGAVLLLGMPYLYSQIPLMLVDIPTMFFLTLAVYLSILAVNKEGLVIIVAASIAITLAMLSKYSTWLFLSVIPFVVLTHEKQSWDDVIKRFILVVGMSMVCFGAIFFFKYEVFLQQIHILLNYQWAALNGWKESNVSTFLFQVHPLIAISAIFSTYIAVKNRDKKYLVISWMLILVFLLQIQRIRYLMVVFPMLALMAAYALAALRSNVLKNYIGYGVAVSSYVMALVIGLNFLPSISANNIKMAGEYLNSTDVNTVEVMVLPQLGSVVNPEISLSALDYHTEKYVVYKQNTLSGQITAPNNMHGSPVKFTWDYSVPAYYLNGPEVQAQENAIALIYSDVRQLNSNTLQSGLSGYRLVKVFNTYSNFFKYRTLVNIYLPV